MKIMKFESNCFPLTHKYNTRARCCYLGLLPKGLLDINALGLHGSHLSRRFAIPFPPRCKYINTCSSHRAQSYTQLYLSSTIPIFVLLPITSMPRLGDFAIIEVNCRGIKMKMEIKQRAQPGLLTKRFSSFSKLWRDRYATRMIVSTSDSGITGDIWYYSIIIKRCNIIAARPVAARVVPIWS